AARLPSYLEFELFCSFDGDTSVLRRMVTTKAELQGRIEAGQEYITQRYLPMHAGLAWHRLFTGRTDTPIRLNLGCGDKILEDHINVDVVPARRGLPPDVLCDLRRLTPFADASVSEILSVHVVEHFWRWEVRDVLKEWRRVLRPGGKLIVE